MTDDLTFLPHPTGLEFQTGPYCLSVVWVEYRRAPARNHYWVSVFKQEEGDIWGGRFDALEEARACFEQRRRDLEQGIIPEMRTSS